MGRPSISSGMELAEREERPRSSVDTGLRGSPLSSSRSRTSATGSGCSSPMDECSAVCLIVSTSVSVAWGVDGRTVLAVAVYFGGCSLDAADGGLCWILVGILDGFKPGIDLDIGGFPLAELGISRSGCKYFVVAGFETWDSEVILCSWAWLYVRAG